ncbi:hypothetical protein PACTADRAFT_60780 [Pachysolen tannophilus NRRL Y-2460]|uniref:DNA repair protein RAD14 n=1 Tax=Pachysolen tannophilus NRRL Y-2460 TaxID=669874 RepID=A0A1E4TRU9_PACTA|nr:hypothetical protein PACTADRAFT_60780 [Pachysolen tannophilus NRRL Y-2460]
MDSERQKKIEANRRKALERLRQRQLDKNNDNNLGSKNTESVASVPQRPKINLTPEQMAIIEENRRKALERKKQRENNLRDASSTTTILNKNDYKISKEINNGSGSTTSLGKRPLDNIRPSIRKQDYIDYDFSTLKDSYGGFISEDSNVAGGNGGENSGQTLEQWKEEQKSKIVMEPPPPVDISSAPRCYECQSIDIDQNLFQIFKCKVCKRCKELRPEKYSLLTKTECREDYLLTDPELKDKNLLHRLEKPNPYSGTYSKMQLFLRYQVEEFAFKKWGGEEGLDKEWARREAMRVDRRDKKFEMKLREMRKKTRAEEYTRKLRENKQQHIHEWSLPLSKKNDKEEGVVRRRCIVCGMETEEFIM